MYTATHLLLLSQNLQLVGHLDLSLSLQLFLLYPSLLPMFLSQGVQSISGVFQLSQLVL